MKRLKLFVLTVSFAVALTAVSPSSFSAYGETVIPAASVADPMPFDLDCESAVLMDSATGTVLYSKNAEERLPPASVTKIMTLLLAMEAIDDGRLKLDDNLQVSEYAASKGGSQVYLEPGETMSVEDIIKSVVIASANDAAVVLAEAVAGSETSFVVKMNEKAAELGLNNTNFENATGLDDTVQNHVTSAYDIAVMSRALISHPLILKYSSIWMDSIRNGEFGLTNTNRLVRFYNGATGLKTGSTAKAKFCISATAERDGLHLIAVIMGAPSRDVRNNAAKTLLDYGFANFALYKDPAADVGVVKVKSGVEPLVKCEKAPFSALLSKSDASNVRCEITVEETTAAPVKKGDVLGKAEYFAGDRNVGVADVTASDDVPKITFSDLFVRMLGIFSLS